MKISIATSYYNRREQFINTLKSLTKSKEIDKIEVVAVDDCSNDENKIDDLTNDFPFLKVITLKKEDRFYINPCIPFNKAIKECDGDIIVLQNPECLHVGDILSDILNRINDENYLTYGVYSINKGTTDFLKELPFDDENIFNMIKSQITPMVNLMYQREGEFGWYNHSIHRPSGYHFVSAITKKNMLKLNGFDERYFNGIGFDDDELLYRIKLLNLDVKIIDSPFAIHQWHYSENNFFNKADNVYLAYKRNEDLFNNVTKKNKNTYV